MAAFLPSPLRLRRTQEPWLKSDEDGRYPAWVEATSYLSVRWSQVAPEAATTSSLVYYCRHCCAAFARFDAVEPYPHSDACLVLLAQACAEAACR